MLVAMSLEEYTVGHIVYNLDQKRDKFYWILDGAVSI